MKNYKKILLALLNFLCVINYSQNQTNKWYFGNQAGLDFTSNPPTILSNGIMATSEGCASISDASGNLLFYTDGATIWNQNHLIMANGSGLFGNGPSYTTQAALVIPQPGTMQNYFVFTMDDLAGPNGLCYSIVDMSLAAGMGSVTTKNVLLNAPCTEGLAAVKHCNGTDIWILIHDWNSTNFRAFLLTASGVSTIGVTSNISSLNFSPTPGTYHSANFLKISPNGKKLGMTATKTLPTAGTFFLFDFDNVSGVVSNSLSVYTHTDPAAYGCEFSSDGSKFYGSTRDYGILHQWDLCTPSNTSIVASHYTMTATDNYAMQLAANGKIYVARKGQQSLGVINNPNEVGSACNYIDMGQPLGVATCSWGLTGFMSTYLKKPLGFLYDHDALGACHTPTFYAPACATTPVPNALAWNFGDPASGAANTSALNNPQHTYPGPGTYTVQLISYFNCSTDTVKQNVVVSSFLPVLNISGQPTVCSGQSTTLTVTGASLYTWSNGANTTTVFVNPTSTVPFIATGCYALGSCSVSSGYSFSVLTLPVLTITAKTTICRGESIILKVSGANTYTWSNNSTASVTTNVPPAGANSYSVIGSFTNGCSAQQNIVVQVVNCTVVNESWAESPFIVYPNPSAGLFTVFCDNIRKMTLSNEIGQVLFEPIFLPGNNVLDLSDQVNGVYFLKDLSQPHLPAIKLGLNK